MAYEFDIFMSYPHAGHVGPWVKNHFLPELRNCLDVHLADDVRIFVDSEQPTGVKWPENTKNALLKSRLLVAVWTPPYFRSNWCVAEWSSMLEREEKLEQDGNTLNRGLVYPVVYSDGKHFHTRARETQHIRDLSKFTCPYPCFKKSVTYLEFHEIVMEIAQEIEEHLEEVPDWQPNWPIVTPEPLQANPINLAGL